MHKFNDIIVMNKCYFHGDWIRLKRRKKPQVSLINVFNSLRALPTTGLGPQPHICTIHLMNMKICDKIMNGGTKVGLARYSRIKL